MRRDIIDVILRNAEWEPKDLLKVVKKLIVSSRISNYKTRSETLKTNEKKHVQIVCSSTAAVHLRQAIKQFDHDYAVCLPGQRMRLLFS
jgi:hypothetical protein